MSEHAPESAKGKPIEEIKVGSVVVSIYDSPTTIKRKVGPSDGGVDEQAAVDGAVTESSKTYESYLIDTTRDPIASSNAGAPEKKRANSPRRPPTV